jgi:hypothetical protein
MKYVFGTAVQNSQKVLILEITALHIVININRLKCKGNVFFVRF